MAQPDTQTPTSENALAETHEPGSDEEAIAALAARLEAEEVADKPDADPGPEVEAEAEADEAETDEAETEEPLVELEIEGKTYKVAPEVEKGYLRQADYSRNMNAVTAEKKAVEAKLEKADKLIEGAEKLAEALASVKQFDAQMKNFEKLDWQTLRRDNPAEYAALSADLNTVRINREEAKQKASQVDATLSDARVALLNQQRAEMDTALKKDLKGWGDEMGATLTKFALDNGVKLETLQALTDPGIVKVLNDAAKYAALQKGKADLKAKVQTAPPVLKPGAARKPSLKDDLMAQHRIHKSDATAEALFLSKMK